MKNNEPLECLECGKQLYKRVCFLKVGNNIIGDEWGVEVFDFCSKPCAFKWLEKNKEIEYFDVDEIKGSRK